MPKLLRPRFLDFFPRFGDISNFKQFIISRLQLSFSAAFVIALLALQSASFETIGQNRFSVATGIWGSTATWSATSGGIPGASVPAVGDVVVIEGGFTVTLNVNTANSLLSLTISAGSTLSTTAAFQVRATTITVNGTYNNGSTGAITVTTMNVNAAGTYIHNQVGGGGTIPTATWSPTSNCNVIEDGSGIAGLAQTFGNFLWDS